MVILPSTLTLEVLSTQKTKVMDSMRLPYLGGEGVAKNSSVSGPENPHQGHLHVLFRSEKVQPPS